MQTRITIFRENRLCSSVNLNFTWASMLSTSYASQLRSVWAPLIYRPLIDRKEIYSPSEIHEAFITPLELVEFRVGSLGSEWIGHHAFFCDTVSPKNIVMFIDSMDDSCCNGSWPFVWDVSHWAKNKAEQLFSRWLRRRCSLVNTVVPVIALTCKSFVF